MFAAENVVLRAAETTGAPTALVPKSRINQSCISLRADQVTAVEAICRSGRRVDVLVGPAGAGKTTAMVALRETWGATHGPRSVIGLAPSAAAAAVLGAEVGATTENTAQWLAQQRQQPARAARIADLEAKRDALAAAGRRVDGIQAAIDRARNRYETWALRPGQLVIVDQAGMADTPTLTALTVHVHAAGAKLLLVGDPEQLPAVGAGGLFRTLVDRRSDTPELVDVQRFRNADGTVRTWEAQASLALRRGDAVAIVAYDAHGRIASGPEDAMQRAALASWQADSRAGRSSLLVAADNETVTRLNLLPRSARILGGEIGAPGVPLLDGTQAGVGDIIVTRRVDRTLHIASHAGTSSTGDGDFVKNGDRFVIDAIGRDGSITAHPERGAPLPGAGDQTGRSTDVRRTTSTTPTSLVLPADYVAQHVQLGYAVSAHRAQGVTVDTTHTVADARMTREAFYVAMTRGRLANRAYVALGGGSPDIDTPVSGSGRDEVLAAILRRSGGQRSAHDMQRTLASATGLEQPAAAQQMSDVQQVARQRSATPGGRTPTGISHIYARRAASRRPNPYDRTR